MTSYFFQAVIIHLWNNWRVYLKDSSREFLKYSVSNIFYVQLKYISEVAIV